MSSSIPYYASTGDVEKIQACIDQGEDINSVDYSQFTAAHMACMYGHVNVLRCLQENGADFSLKNDNGNTPLLLAAEKGFIDCVKYLVEECNAPIEDRNIWQATPVQMACVFGAFDIVKYLVEEKNASLKVVNKYGANPLHFSFAGGQIEIIRWLILRDLGDKFKNSNPEAINNYLSTRFVNAAKHKVPLLAFENVKLISVNHFLEAGEYPIYALCDEKGWHVEGSVINDSTRILFISHRWETPHHPDPEQVQYQLVVDFLKNSGREYDYVWLDFACITQDKSSPLFAVHLSNIPTALFCSNECLVVPKIDEVGDEMKATNLKDYLDRGWCQLEAIVAMFTGCETFVVYKGGDHIEYPHLTPYRGTHEAGFAKASSTSLKSMKVRSRNQVRNLWDGATEPTEALKKFTDATIVCHHQYPELFGRIISMGLDIDDIVFMGQQTDDIFLGPGFLEAYRNLGNFTSEDDRIIVVRLLMFSIAYCMYDLEEEGYLDRNESVKTLESVENFEEAIPESAKTLETVEEAIPESANKQEDQEAPRSSEPQTSGNVVVANQKKGCGCVMM